MELQPNQSSISFKVGFNQSVNNEFKFRQPDEAPVFRPTIEEFNIGPLEYIKKIRPLAEPYGICKIIPPPEFKPEFEVDPNKFMFKPRVQRINELEALTRAKLCFFEKIIKYWNLQGVSLKIPTIDRKIVDLYKLHRTVYEEGGFENCVRDKLKWTKVVAKLYPFPSNPSKTVSSLLKQHYERILYPYDIFVSGATTGGEAINENGIKLDSNNNKMDTDIKKELEIKDEQLAKTSSVTDSEMGQESLISNKRSLGEDDNCCDDNCVTKKGKTGRTISRRSSARLSSMSNSPVSSSSSYTKMMNINDAINNQNSNDFSTPERSTKVFCKLCNMSREQDRSRKLLECDSCKDNFHLNCLIIPLNSHPKGKWNCPRCISELVPKLPKLYTREFGFAESRCKYTLKEFGEEADKFKREYFNKELDEINCDIVEKEFWRLVTCIDDMCTVEYGADLHTNLVGSGFASMRNEKNSSLEYINHPWNLNKLPLLEGSLFKYVNSNINGMIVPWIYVGMCFSTFCWHNEDHWTYSINYNHYGDVKTWYGVPGERAPEFEEAMVNTAPELFEASPDLLHQLVTICNPNILQDKNVPIYRLNQNAGEFVITFPRSYHAGFNQGFNIAEAVNFAPTDWLELGRECMDSYSKVGRYPVFSQDELICNISTSSRLNVSLLNLVYDDLLSMVKKERNLRKEALEFGITKSQAVYFNTLPDDERQCDFCKTTCYLSALTCACEEKKLVCLSHMKDLCKRCDSHKFILKYTFKLDELVTILKNLEDKLERYQKISLKLKTAVNFLSQSESSNNGSTSGSNNNKIKLNKLINLKKKSEELNISNRSKLIQKLNKAIDDSLLLQEKMHKILDFNDEEKLTFNEFKLFIDSVNDLNVGLDRNDELNDLYSDVRTLIEEIQLTKQQNKKLDNKLLSKLTDKRFCFLNLDEFLDGQQLMTNNMMNSHKPLTKRKRVNRNVLLSPIRNSAF